MKSLIFAFLLLLNYQAGYAQSVSINTDGSLPHASAILDIKSGVKGMLLPRTSTSSRLAIVNPAKGLIVYDTISDGLWIHNGSAWSKLSVGNNGWNLNGNAAINPANSFIGTTDEQPLRFRVNNAWAGEIHPTSYNLFLGVGSGQANTGGQSNTAIGYHSLLVNTNGGLNTAGGYEALSGNTTGNNNTGLGGYALYNNTVGSSNTAIGRNALFANTSGNFNTAIGNGALLTNITGNYNTANGSEALYNNTTGSDNTATGRMALYFNTTGAANVANGNTALYYNTTGSLNTATGNSALQLNTIGYYNSAHGYAALFFNTTGIKNTATGAEALHGNATGIENTATGFKALQLNTAGFSNTATGTEAMSANIDGFQNTANGVQALAHNLDGSNNVAMGSYALYSTTTGHSNTGIGSYSLYNNTTGTRNIAIGISSGIHPGTPGIFNTVSIGNDGLLNAFQNQVIIGNNSTAFIGGKVTWSVVSDARIKNTVTEDVKGLDFILRLRPVTYHISNKAMTTVTGNKETPDFPGKYDGEKVKYTGFLAQEVEKAAQAAGYDFSGYAAPKNQWGLYTLSYEQFVVPLVKAMQEQQEIIKQQQQQLKDQQEQLDRQEKRLAALETK